MKQETKQLTLSPSTFHSSVLPEGAWRYIYCYLLCIFQLIIREGCCTPWGCCFGSRKIRAGVVSCGTGLRYVRGVQGEKASRDSSGGWYMKAGPKPSLMLNIQPNTHLIPWCMIYPFTRFCLVSGILRWNKAVLGIYQQLCSMKNQRYLALAHTLA